MHRRGDKRVDDGRTGEYHRGDHERIAAELERQDHEERTGGAEHPGDEGVRDARAVPLPRFDLRPQERRWHPSQQVKALNATGSRVEVRFEVGRLEELVRWTLSWGGQAKVREPKELKALVRAEAAEIQADG